jgi:hypothetical protein
MQNNEVARRLGAAPSSLGFGGPVARLALDAMEFILLNSSFCIELVRSPGVAPGQAPWRGAILLLNHNREIKRAGTCFSPGPCHFNKEQTPLAISLRYQPTVSRWFFRCLEAHLLRSL